MNFEQYKTWRDDLLANREILSENRFDCLNPFKAMDFSQKWEAPIPRGGLQADLEEVVALWHRVHLDKYATARNMHAEATKGVRSALGVLFERMEAEGVELWLPEDVYPFYLQEANARAPGLAIRFFRTMPEIDFEALRRASDNAALLITNPLTPTGRRLSFSEMTVFREWTRQSSSRWAIFDSVYLYDTNPLPYQTYSKDRILHLFSLSKSWLLRGVFGTIVGPKEIDGWWKNLGLTPSPEACASARRALLDDPKMPARQRDIFRREWKRRRPKLERYGAVFEAGEGGYFKLVPMNFEQALEEDGILLVPATVFGSRNVDLSIATCLYEAARFNAVR
jgi:aspartate/methionine/tyrosine aminotransferase